MALISSLWWLFKVVLDFIIDLPILFKRLFYEDPGVKSCAWFASTPDGILHFFANTLRVAIILIFSPIYAHILPVKACAGELLKKRKWFIESPSTPDAVLLNSPSPSGG
ncbi:hypothetical protein M422DRAFT_164956, partial [Sphaerobolus stellatus SS14]